MNFQMALTGEAGYVHRDNLADHNDYKFRICPGYMLNHILHAINQEISGENAKNVATEITRFHRIQVSPHFREAAEWCNHTLREYGLSSEILQYEADGEKMYWSYCFPEEWSVESGTLVIDGDVWAQFRDKKISIIQRSHPIDVEAEIVMVSTDDERAFDEVKGKIVYSPLTLEKIKDQALHHGAVGIITSGIREITMRTRLDIPEATHYFSFWGERGSGFILSPKEGEKLEKLLETKSVKGKMIIRSSLYPGYMEVVNAFIPGKTEEEVLIVAHLCHPQPSANDNASGSGALMEVARALQTLIDTHRLDQPRRGIRFLLVPEISGTVTYLASRQGDLNSIIAALNLDMVGENQDLCNSPLLLERTPDAMPSFVNDVAELILEELTQEIGNLAGTSKYASFKHAVTPFSGGSDHFVLSDPSVGVPCPMIIHWPDLFYHCSLDTPDKLDAMELDRVGLLTAAYAYFIASAGEPEARWLATLVCEKAKERIIKEVRNILTTPDVKSENQEPPTEDRPTPHEMLDYILEREVHALQSIQNLSPIDTRSLEDELRDMVETEKQKLPRVERKREEKELGWIPRRKYPGPISTRKVLLELPYEEKRAYEKRLQDFSDGRIMGTLAIYWTDGRRTLSEIHRMVRREMGKSSLDFLMWYFEFLHTQGLIELQK
ncbi:MAG: DUF4910 domain-containing protein [Theionarchaea archaeon]|nr:DUF4910 domain-containing protein [Theionarchaea archaeon]